MKKEHDYLRDKYSALALSRTIKRTHKELTGRDPNVWVTRQYLSSNNMDEDNAKGFIYVIESDIKLHWERPKI